MMYSRLLVEKVMTILRRISLLPVLLSIMLQGCALATSDKERADAFPDQEKERADQVEDPQALSMEGLLTYKYLMLQEARNKGDLETALRILHELLELAPSPDIYVEAVTLLDQNNQPLDALRLAGEGTHVYPNEYPLHMVWVDLLYRQRDVEEAANVLRRLAGRYEDLNESERKKFIMELTGARQLLLLIWLENGQTGQMLDYMRGIPKSEHSPLMLFYEVLALRRDKHNRQANAKLHKLMQNHPGFTDGWLTLAQDMENAGNYKNAAKFYQKAFESAQTIEIYQFLLRAMIKSGSPQDAFALVMRKNLGEEGKLRSALIFMEERQYVPARHILLTLEKDPEQADDAALYLGMIAYDSGEHMQEALKRLQNISPDAPNRLRMLHLKILLHLRLEEYDDAFASAQTLRDDYPDDKNSWVLLSELANNRKQFKLAEEVSREGLEQWPDDIQLLYSLSMSLSFQKRNAEAIQILEEILLLDESSVMVMNALGYILAEEKRDLERAVALIKKALEYRPEDVNILDSLAWAHYQMDNYSEAWRVIKQCELKGANDATIWDHYGDIALAVKDKQSALKAYSKAIELKADNSAEIRAKLEKLK
jgi:tetratricopeptide (TPR) repeat protein